MSTIGFIKRGLDFAHKALADARNGTDEQLHFVPPNGSHSIAWCLWHTTRVEDLIINARILKQPMIWNGEWAERTGLPAEGFGAGQADDDAQKVHIGDMEDDLVRVLDPVSESVSSTYLLVHPDLRNVPRVRALFDFMVSEIESFRPLLGHTR
jgi:hypothetical protein